MKLVLKVKLHTTLEQDDSLQQTRHRYVCALNWLSEYAFEHQAFCRRDLHHGAYYELRSRFDLPSQFNIRAIDQVRDAYKALKAQIKEHNRSCKLEERRALTRIVFRQDAAVIYDERILSWKTGTSTISLSTLCGRIMLPFQEGRDRQPLLAHIRGQADLKRYGKVWYLFQTIDIPVPQESAASEFLGIDVGIGTIAAAVNKDGSERFHGNRVRQTRRRYSAVRKDLGHRNTKSSKRRIKALGQKESRIVRNINHEISARIVRLAQRTNSILVLEDLSDVNEGAKERVSREQRYEQMSWTYSQLHSFIAYKAKLVGVKVVFAQPEYTSQTCSRCLYCHRSNRKGWLFRCGDCGFMCHADENAGRNLQFLGYQGAVMSDRHKRGEEKPVSMRAFLHRDKRLNLTCKPLALAMG